MKKEQDRQKKAMQEQEQKYKKQMKASDEQVALRRKLKDIRKDISEANEIAKFMAKRISFHDFYVSKFDEGSLNEGTAEFRDEVQIKVENAESGHVYVWDQEKFRDKLVEMRDAL